MGALLAVFGYATMERIRRIRVLREVQKELLGRIESEMTFVEMATRLKKEMEMERYDD
jgi:hypothetical protein